MPQCAFCLREAKLSGEHVWSDWICELFPDIRVTFRKWHAGNPNVVNEWNAESMDHRVNVVCKPCNEGWMSDLEAKHASPAIKPLILSPNSVTLTTEQLVSISIFAFKTAVIGDHTERQKLPFFPALIRRKFANTLKLPIGFQVWIGCISESDPHHGVFRRHYWEAPTKARHGFQIYGTTWGVGRFVFQCTATRWRKRGDRRHMLPHLTQDHNWDSFAIPVWPMLDGPFIAKWPPARHLGYDLLYEFSDRWNRIRYGNIWKG